MKKIHLIMPMSGAGSRFKKNGYELPKPIIEIKGKPFFYWATRSIEKFVDLLDITFVILQKHVDEFNLDKMVKKYFPNAKFIILSDVTAGPVFTCLEGLKDITDDNPILFNDCDHMFKCQKVYDVLNNWEKNTLDGVLLTFEADAPQFSYVKYDEDGNIVETVEKKVVSNHAICGAYIFRNATLFKAIASEYIKTCPYQECFISGMYNIMCNHNMKVKDFVLDFHVEFGTPEEYETAKKSEYFYKL